MVYVVVNYVLECEMVVKRRRFDWEWELESEGKEGRREGTNMLCPWNIDRCLRWLLLDGWMVGWMGYAGL